MASVVINGDTSGSVTLQAPATAGATVLTLPSTSGTIVITSGAQTIEFADGSVSAPSITNSGDTNTGIFFPAADTIAFAEGGTEAMRLDASGNVGIGTASPGSRLEVSSSATSAAAGFTSTNTNSDGYSTLQLKNTGASGRTYTIALGGNTSANPGIFYVYDDTAAANRLNITSTGLLQFNSGYGSAATAYGCRSWVNFNGTGAVAIRGSGNVTSITDNGTGDYTVNFTTAMPDANYSPVFGVGRGSTDGNASVTIRFDTAPTASALRITTQFSTVVTLQDFVYVNVAIFR